MPGIISDLLGPAISGPQFRSLALSFFVFFAGVRADELPKALDTGVTFVTRPEIAVPTWNITVYDQESWSSGYWFVSPYASLDDSEDRRKEGWIAPMIFDDAGELVWNGAYLTEGHTSFDFRVSNVHGEEMLTFLYPRNRSAVVLNGNYEVFKQLEISGVNSTEMSNIHEFNFVDGGTKALMFYDKTINATKPQSKEIGFDGKCLIRETTFRESNLDENWRFSYRWSASKRIDLAESTNTDSTLTQRCNETADGWDWVQANSVDKFENDYGRYILSARLTNTIYKLYRSGDVMWRLGGEKNEFQTDFVFTHPGNVRVISHNQSHTVISFFDEGDAAQDSARPSRGLLVSLETETEPKKATLLAEYAHPLGGHVTDHGSMQVLPGGNVFSGWTDGLLMSEHAADGTLLMEAHVEQAWLKSYRSYKFPFVGRPTQPPDAYAEVAQGQATTTVYMSWNGATEVDRWSVYQVGSSGDPAHEPAIIVSRSGFETKVEIDGHVAQIVAEALNQDGMPLGRSQLIRTVGLSAPKLEIAQDIDTPTADAQPAPATSASWRDKAKESAEQTVKSKTGIAGLLAVFLLVGALVVGLRKWTRRRQSWTSKHNRKSSDHQMLGRYTAVGADDDMEAEEQYGSKCLE